MLSTVAVQSQQLPMFSQYISNDFILNPAVAGSKPYFPIKISSRSQWSSLGSLAPQTNILSYHMPVAYDEIGVGAVVMQDQTGPYSHLSVNLAFAYHLQLDDDNTTRLSFGLSGQLSQHTLKMDELEFNNPDPEFQGGNYTKIVPDANVGAYLYSENYFLSIASHQLFESTFKEAISPVFGDNDQVRHYYANAGYVFNVYSDLRVEPSILVKVTEVGPVQFDFNTRVMFNNSVWTGLSLRSSQALVLIAGVKMGALNLSYSYDYGISSIGNFSSGSHEVCLGFNISDKRNRRHSYYW